MGRGSNEVWGEGPHKYPAWLWVLIKFLVD